MFSLLQQSAVAPPVHTRGAARAGSTPPREWAHTSPCGTLRFRQRHQRRVHHLAPPLVARGVGGVTVVPVPPFVRWGLRIALRGVLPLFLAPERSHVEIAPGAPHRLVAAVVDEVGTEKFVAVAEKHVGAVPLVHAEVSVEAVRDGVPGYLPSHS